MQILQPPDWVKPRGYSNGVALRGGTTVYVAGQVGWNKDGKFAEKSFGGQFRQALANIIAVVAEAGGRPEHIARMTWYVVNRNDYFGALGEISAAYRALMGRHYPAMTVIEVRGLMDTEARLEIEATAVVPD